MELWQEPDKQVRFYYLCNYLEIEQTKNESYRHHKTGKENSFFF